MIKCIFWDFGWVIIRFTKPDWSHEMAKIYNVDLDVFKKISSIYRDKFRRWEIEEKKFRKDLSNDLVKPIPLNINKIFNIPPQKYSILNKSIVNFVKKLRREWYKSIILSDVVKPIRQATAKVWRYDGFDWVIFSCDVWLSKYDDFKNWTTKIYDYALKKYKLNPSEVIFVDDVKGNCEVAQKIWIRTILAEGPRQVIRDIKKILKIK